MRLPLSDSLTEWADVGMAASQISQVEFELMPEPTRDLALTPANMISPIQVLRTHWVVKSHAQTCKTLAVVTHIYVNFNDLGCGLDRLERTVGVKHGQQSCGRLQLCSNLGFVPSIGSLRFELQGFRDTIHLHCISKSARCLTSTQLLRIYCTVQNRTLANTHDVQATLQVLPQEKGLEQPYKWLY